VLDRVTLKYSQEKIDLTRALDSVAVNGAASIPRPAIVKKHDRETLRAPLTASSLT
jgi:hypothetical protein